MGKEKDRKHMPLLLDLDNTLLPSKLAYEFAIEKLAEDWSQKNFGTDFLELYEKARKEVKNQLSFHSSNRLRILCFKLMLEKKTKGLESKIIKDILWLDDRYFLHFESFLQNQKKKPDYTKELFPRLVQISEREPVFLVTNETLRTQLLKLQNFFPPEFRYQLITSEEVGFEKPSTEFFSYVLRKVDAKREDCLMVGDNWEDDILGAAKHGITAVHLKSQFGEKSALEPVKIPDSKEFPFGSKIYSSTNVLDSLDFVWDRLSQSQK
ncbi:MAG: HAD-IA family hydrolase [Leptospira sp.]|nr:HAD-IA family hydrolase [Leptospira sp.]